MIQAHSKKQKYTIYLREGEDVNMWVRVCVRGYVCVWEQGEYNIWLCVLNR